MHAGATRCRCLLNFSPPPSSSHSARWPCWMPCALSYRSRHGGEGDKDKGRCCHLSASTPSFALTGPRPLRSLLLLLLRFIRSRPLPPAPLPLLRLSWRPRLLLRLRLRLILRPAAALPPRELRLLLRLLLNLSRPRPPAPPPAPRGLLRPRLLLRLLLRLTLPPLRGLSWPRLLLRLLLLLLLSAIRLPNSSLRACGRGPLSRRWRAIVETVPTSVILRRKTACCRFDTKSAAPPFFSLR